MDPKRDNKDAKIDALLGEIAVKKGLVTPERLREAQAEQAEGVARGRKRPRRLGVILAERRSLTDRQVFSLLEEAERRAAENELNRDHDTLFGRILVDAGLAEAERVAECLLIQSDAETAPPRLGELLIAKGYATPSDIDQALELQQKIVLLCTACGNRCHFSAVDPKDPDLCPVCKAPMEALPPSEESIPAPAARPKEEKGRPPPPRKPQAPSETDADLPPTPAALESASSQTTFQPSAKIGKYILGRLVGRGGMGDVYEATDFKLNRRVALKIMRKSPYADPEESAREVERFVREAQFAAQMSKHPNVVTVYEAGTLEGRHFIAMEYIAGEGFASWQRKHAANLRGKVKILRDVALAVHHAHQAGVLHRDLKPENILVNEEGEAYVTDFGLAKLATADVRASLTLSGHICGTPVYMSPEQAEGNKRLDRRSDVYSLGVMLYEILAGRPPVRGDSPLEILLKKIKEEPAPPSAVAKTLGHAPVDKALDGICMKALAHDPNARYATAEAFAKDLSHWLQGRQIKTSRAAVKPKTRAWLYASGAAVLLGLFAVVGLTATNPSLDRRLSQAQKLMDEKNYGEALSAYETLLRQSPGSEKARQGRDAARAEVRKAQAAAALAEVEQALTAEELARREASQLTPTHPKRAEADRRLREAEARRKRAQERLRDLVSQP